MKKTASKKGKHGKHAKRSLSEILQKTSAKEHPSMKVRKFSVNLVIEGDMLDKDTPISEHSLAAYFQMQYACPKGMKIHFMEAKEIVHEPPLETEPTPAEAAVPAPAAPAAPPSESEPPMKI